MCLHIVGYGSIRIILKKSECRFEYVHWTGNPVCSSIQYVWDITNKTRCCSMYTLIQQNLYYTKHLYLNLTSPAWRSLSSFWYNIAFESFPCIQPTAIVYILIESTVEYNAVSHACIFPENSSGRDGYSKKQMREKANRKLTFLRRFSI